MGIKNILGFDSKEILRIKREEKLKRILGGK